jgi:hypothetical protein
MNREIPQMPGLVIEPERYCLKCQHPLNEAGLAKPPKIRQAKCRWCGQPYDIDDPNSYGPSHKKCPIGIDAKWA